MVNVSIDFAPAQLEFLQRLLDEGRYRSRSEAVRDFVRRAEFDIVWKETIRECSDKTIDIDAVREEISGPLLKRYEANVVKNKRRH